MGPTRSHVPTILAMTQGLQVLVMVQGSLAIWAQSPSAIMAQSPTVMAMAPTVNHHQVWVP